MGIFDKLTEPWGKRIFVTIVFFVTAVVIGLHLLSYVLTVLFQIPEVKIAGMYFTLASVGVLLLAATVLAGSIDDIDSKSLWGLLIIAAITLFVLFLVPKIVPQIYSASILQMKTTAMSVLGM